MENNKNLKMDAPSTVFFDHELPFRCVGSGDSSSQEKDVLHRL